MMWLLVLELCLGGRSDQEQPKHDTFFLTVFLTEDSQLKWDQAQTFHGMTQLHGIVEQLVWLSVESPTEEPWGLLSYELGVVLLRSVAVGVSYPRCDQSEGSAVFWHTSQISHPHHHLQHQAINVVVFYTWYYLQVLQLILLFLSDLILSL